MDVTNQQFEKIGQLVQGVTGIQLKSGKEALVSARLARRVRALGLDSIDDYMVYIESGSNQTEITTMIDSLTTNKTSFFRESAHFDYLTRSVLPKLAGQKQGIRLWSAGCSSGEEPYTLAITLSESLSACDLARTRILATDISSRVLEKAQRGIYTWEQIRDIPKELITKYFSRIPGSNPPSYRVSDKARALVRFARLNLMERWPMKGPFDAIFCRNVMIYFDKPTTRELVRRFEVLLAPGGHLFVGHSESMTGHSDGLRYVQPAVYAKIA